MSFQGLQWRLHRFCSLVRASVRKAAWRAFQGTSGPVIPVFIVGSQRSGTGMLGECLGQSPEFVNLGESDRRAFHGYSLRDDSVVGGMIDRCRYRHLVFKPLKDSHRVAGLLSIRPGGRALWAYRNPLDRINSAVRQFGAHPLKVFAAFQSGDRGVWQMAGASADVERVVSGFDIDRLTEADGAALMWWVRNSLYFDLDLQEDSRVRLWSYDAFVSDPESELRRLLDFLDGRYYPYMLHAVHSRSLRKHPEPALNGGIRDLCALLHARLESESAKQAGQQV